MTSLLIHSNSFYLFLDDKQATIIYNLPVNHTNVIDGNCTSNLTNTIDLGWGTVNKSNVLTLEFTRNETTKDFKLSAMKFTLKSFADDLKGKCKLIVF